MGAMPSGRVNRVRFGVGSPRIGDVTYWDGKRYVRLPAGPSGTFLKSNGQAAPSWATCPVIRVQKFTTNGTYTPHPNMVYCIIEVVGGGGGGGGVGNSPSGSQWAGGGGGAGSYARLMASAATIGASKAVTIGLGGTAGPSGGGSAAANTGGAGGDTSVGSLCIGKGGSPGGGSISATNTPGGLGGVAGTGDITIPGESGSQGAGAIITSALFAVNRGGSSLFGAGAPGLSVNATGINGGLYGAGASGASTLSAGGAFAGGVGAPGIVIITEFCTQ